MNNLIAMTLIGALLNSSQAAGMKPSCRAHLSSSTATSALLSQASKLKAETKTVSVTLEKRGITLETQAYIVYPDRVKPGSPVVMLNPGLSKSMFIEQAHKLASLGYIAFSYNHLNVGSPVVGPIEAPTVEEDAELALQVFNSLPSDITNRGVLLVPHSRGALVAGALAHKLLSQGTEIKGIYAQQPYIYWQLEHMFVELEERLESSLNIYFKSLLPYLARILTPFAARVYDSSAERAAKRVASRVKDSLYDGLVTANYNLDAANESMNFPTLMKLALEQVLKDADEEEIDNILEKLKGMQPTPGQDAPFLGDFLVGLEEFPIAIISSEFDDLSTPGMAKSLRNFTEKSGMQNVSYVSLSGTGHYFPYDSAYLFARMIDQMWQDQQAE